MVVSLLFAVITTLGPIALVVWAVRQRQGARPVDGRSVRRFFQYVLLYGLMVVVATGLAELLGLLLEQPSIVGDDRTALARSLTFTLFGIPMLALAAAWTRRNHRRDPEEAQSLGWVAYVTALALTALALTMTGVHDVASTALTGDGLAGGGLAGAVVWAGVWWGHWVLAHRMLGPGRRLPLLFLGSLVGLVVSVVGLVLLLSSAAEALVVTTDVLVLTTRDALAEAGATVLVGVPVWVLHWARGLARTGRSAAWLGYVLPVGVGGSTVLAVVGASLAVYQLLVWLVGEPSSGLAVRHFAGTPAALACAVVGALSWWYHRQVLGAAGTARTEVTRVYDYLMAGVALLAAAAGTATVLVAVIEAISPAPAFQAGSAVVNTLLAGVTLLVVGGPLWWHYWSGIARAARSDPPVELGAPTRRVYLFLLFGVGGITAVISVLVAAFTAIQGVLASGFDLEVLRDMRVPIALLVAAGAISGYHWTVHREDRSHLPQAPPVLRQRYVLLIGAAEPDARQEVARRTGSRVELWPRLDAGTPPWQVDDVVAAVEASAAPAVTVVAGPAGIEVIPMAPR